MRVKVSMREALSEPEFFGTILAAASWYAWRVLLLAAAGEELLADERAEFARLTGREREPGHMVRELVAIFGRRAGKSLASPSSTAGSPSFATIATCWRQVRPASCCASVVISV